MKVIFLPLRLFFLASLLVLFLPLVAWQVALYYQAPWWSLPHDSIRFWLIIHLAWMLPTLLGLWRAKRVCYPILLSVALGWCTYTLFLAIYYKNWWMGMFFILLAFLWSVFLKRVQYEMNRSFMNPQLKWYQGSPPTIPQILCHCRQDQESDQGVILRVARMDQDGVFLFSKDEEDWKKVSEWVKDTKRDFFLSFEHKDKKCGSFGVPILMLESNKGVGMQFKKVSPDQKKDLGDLIEALRGEGYVS